MDFSVNIYPFKDRVKTDYQGVCNLLSDMGFMGIEPVHGLIPDSPAVLRDVPRSLGMTLVSGFVMIDDMIGGDSESLFSFYHDAGVTRLVAGVIPNPDDEAYGSLASALHAVEEAARRSRDAGFDLLIHNHERSLIREPDGRLLLEHFADIDGVKLELDVGFVHAAELDVRATLDLFAPKIGLIHLKDVTEHESSVNLGEGDVDFHVVLTWCAEHGIPYPMVEHHLADPAEEDLKKSFEYVDRVAREIGI